MECECWLCSRLITTMLPLPAQIGFSWCWTSLPPTIEHWGINARSAAVSGGLVISYCAQSVALAVSGDLLCAAQMWLLSVTVFTCSAQLVRGVQWPLACCMAHDAACLSQAGASQMPRAPPAAAAAAAAAAAHAPHS